MGTNTPVLSRRTFLARSSLAVAAPTVLPARVFGATAPSRRVTTGHIGVGGQGGGLLGGFLGLPQVQVIATCDPLKSRREQAAQRVESHYATQSDRGSYKGCQAYNDLREMLAREDLDAVVIATPDHWHVPAALLAVRAGKDVYVEKPLGAVDGAEQGTPRGGPSARGGLPVRHAAAVVQPALRLRLRVGP